MIDDDFRLFTAGIVKRLILCSVFGVHGSAAVEKIMHSLVVLTNDSIVQLHFVIFWNDTLRERLLNNELYEVIEESQEEAIITSEPLM
ncbi:hypothetical protein CKAH01_14404 [Colletotrichum kahawae]|uniref:Uncharacterized protein n=1 Tax=Colletotrichum kahawae TaxID=34407 RepID=A0AAD9YME9_COLKA|nr:hypothetical protein CKAH01_14404 [Colletotrichum kahawae]